MKRILLLLLFPVVLHLNCFATGINYSKKSWDEVRAKAKEESKYIFVDCYTDWCGWCKVMDKETMKSPEIVSILNEKFIAVKLDMEHGEGIKLSMKYQITGYPTFLFFNTDGQLVYTSAGYAKPNEFLQEIKNSLDKVKQNIAPGYSVSLNINYPDFYLKAFGDSSKEFPTTEKLISYLDQQKDLFSEVNWAVLSRFSNVGDKYNNFFLENKAKYASLFGEKLVDERVFGYINDKINSAIKLQDEKKLDSTLALVDKYIKENTEATKTQIQLAFYKSTEKWEKCAAIVDGFIGKFENEGFLLNEISWAICENCKDKNILLKACSWMETVVKKTTEYAYMDTYATLLYKSRQQKQAETWAKKAIAQGKKEKKDTKATEKLLKKITTPKK